MQLKANYPLLCRVNSKFIVQLTLHFFYPHDTKTLDCSGPCIGFLGREINQDLESHFLLAAIVQFYGASP